MKTAQITYYGEGPLNLQMRRFKAGKSVKTRLDDILPDERRRYGDRFLIVGPDGLIINIGSMVPDDVAKETIGVNPRVLRIPGFDVRIPPGFALDNSGAEPRIVDAAVLAARNDADVLEPKSLKAVIDDAGTEPSPSRPTEEGDHGEQEESAEGEHDEEGHLQAGKENQEEPDGAGSEEALGSGGAGIDEADEGAQELENEDGDPGGQDTITVITPPTPVADIKDQVVITDDEVIVTKTQDPTLTDSATKPAKKRAKKRTSKKKKAAKKKTAKKSSADDLMGMF